MARRFEIEPLGEARWARIERSLHHRMDAGEGLAAPAPPSPRAARPVAAFVLAGAAAAVIGAIAWESMRGHGGVPSISRVATDAASSHVELAGATVDVGPHSSVSVSGSDAEGLTLVLDQGDIDCEVMPRVGRPPFVVLSGHVSVRVVGTHFHVSRSGEATQVRVERGTVEVDEGDTRTPVHGGEQWPVAAVLDSPAPSAVPAASAVPSSSPVVAAPHGIPVPSASAPASAVTPRETYEEAIAIEASEPDVALARYRELARGTGPWAMNALFAEGRLEAERGHDDEAKKLLDEYLLRFPSGPNAPDARDLRARLR